MGLKEDDLNGIGPIAICYTWQQIAWLQFFQSAWQAIPAGDQRPVRPRKSPDAGWHADSFSADPDELVLLLTVDAELDGRCRLRILKPAGDDYAEIWSHDLPYEDNSRNAYSTLEPQFEELSRTEFVDLLVAQGVDRNHPNVGALPVQVENHRVGKLPAPTANLVSAHLTRVGRTSISGLPGKSVFAKRRPTSAARPPIPPSVQVCNTPCLIDADELLYALVPLLIQHPCF